MQRALNASLWWTMGAMAALAVGSVGAPAMGLAAESNAMPVADQNALVKKYCAVCHNETMLAGGLSLVAFDAAHPDPSVAGMMVSKLQGGAMGAAGIAQPEPAAIAALTSALAAAALDAPLAAGGWTLRSFNGGAAAVPLVTATIKQDVPSPGRAGESSGYELTFTCQKVSDTAEGPTAIYPAQVRLASNRNTPSSTTPIPRPMPAGNGVSAPFTYEIDGRAGEPAIDYATQGAAATFVIPIPSRSLTIRNAFPGETVTFPFDKLSEPIRRVLSTCVSRTRG